MGQVKYKPIIRKLLRWLGWLVLSAIGFALVRIFWPPSGPIMGSITGLTNYSTVLLAADGSLLYAALATDWQWRFAATDSLPTKYKVALLMSEDRYFEQHVGFNPISICRALWVNMHAGISKQGGSTITQQAVRLSRHNPSRTLTEKMSELLEALRWEVWLTKAEILNYYAANAPMGSNVVGFSTACWRYFGTLPNQISWAQAATLAILPNAPAAIHLGKSRNRLLLKRNKLLARLRDLGHITPDIYSRAIIEELTGNPRVFPQKSPHLLQYLAKQYGAGKCHNTTIDPEVQQLTQSLLASMEAEKKAQQINNIGLLVIRLRDQAVIAYHGNYPNTQQLSTSQNLYIQAGGTTNQFVDMVQAKRSYGSLLKPFLYATALTDGKITPQAWLEDVPKTYEGSYAPRNFNNQYQGVVRADIALAHSLNIPFVNLQRSVGTARFMQSLQALGIKSIDKSSSHYGLSLILGGGEASLYELCQAYTLLANSQQHQNAIWNTSFGITSVVGNKTSWNIKTPLWSAATATITTKALQLADRPDMDAAVRLLVQRQSVAWKTGTSWGLRDAWCIGYNNDYLVGVWLGNASGEGVAGLTGIRKAAPIMFRVLDLLPSGDMWPDPAMGWHQLNMCTVTGHPASDYCDSVLQTKAPIPLKSNSPCPYHHQVFTDAHSRFQLNMQCAGSEKIIKRNYLILPPALAWYYAPAHPTYKPPPPPRADCDKLATVQILYPQDGAIIMAPSGQFVAKAYCSTKRSELLWLLDGQPIGETDGPHKQPIFANVGPHTLTVVGDQGVSVRFTIKN